MKLGTETGSLVNHLMSGSASVVPVVGMGCTMLMWSDRHAGTVVKVTRTQVHVQRDRATMVGGNISSESQEYHYEPRPDAPVQVFRLNKHGEYRGNGMGLRLGVRREYYDPTF